MASVLAPTSLLDPAVAGPYQRVPIYPRNLGALGRPQLTQWRKRLIQPSGFPNTVESSIELQAFPIDRSTTAPKAGATAPQPPGLDSGPFSHLDTGAQGRELRVGQPHGNLHLSITSALDLIQDLTRFTGSRADEALMILVLKGILVVFFIISLMFMCKRIFSWVRRR